MSKADIKRALRDLERDYRQLQEVTLRDYGIPYEDYFKLDFKHVKKLKKLVDGEDNTKRIAANKKLVEKVIAEGRDYKPNYDPIF